MASWTVIATEKRSVVSVQTLTDSAPTLDTDGMGLQSVAGFSVTVEADTGQTLSGAGTLACYVYGYCYNVPGWSRASDLDIMIPVAIAGNRRYISTGFQVSAPRGRIAFIASGVTVSSGALTLYQIANDLYGNDV